MNSQKLAEDLDILALARALPRSERERILLDMRETEFHPYLRDMLAAAEPSNIVEVTHGPNELGKDVVAIAQGSLHSTSYAYVVKKGDVGGKTAGDVDSIARAVNAILEAPKSQKEREILSQIEQSKRHPAKLRGLIEDVPIDRVVVVIVGELSQNARIRLQQEVASVADIWSLPKIVDLFTNHYPQVFFEAQAIDHLNTLITRLEEDTLLSKKGKSLSSCFIEPYIAPVERGAQFDDAQYVLRLASNRLRLSLLYERLHGGAKILLLGDPGSGKSKALAKMCLDRYRIALAGMTRRNGGTIPMVKIPVLVKAQRIYSELQAPDGSSPLIPADLVERFGISAIFVDGLDEVPSAARSAVLAAAIKAADDAEAGLLVASRKLSMLSEEKGKFTAFEILPLEMSQAFRMIEKLATDATTLPALQEGLRKIGDQVPLNPLSIIMLMDLVVEHKEVPASVGELYDRYLDIAVGRWDQDRGVASLFEYQVKKKFLASLAYRLFYQNNQLEAPRVMFDEFIRAYAGEYGWNEQDLIAFVSEIERAGILVVEDEVFFRHRSFLDYFVASWVAEKRADFPSVDDHVTQLYFSDLWAESAFFYSAIRREVSAQLLAKIAAYNGEEPLICVSKVMIGRLLQAGWHSTAGVRGQGVDVILDNLPATREAYARFFSSAEAKHPTVFVDIVMLMLADSSLRSTFLGGEIDKRITEASQRSILDAADARRGLTLLWVRRGAALSTTGQTLAKRIADAQLDAADETSVLALVGVVSSGNNRILKTIRRRLTRIREDLPALFSKVLLSPSKQSRRTAPIPRVRRP